MPNWNAIQTAKDIRVAHTDQKLKSTWQTRMNPFSTPFRDEENPAVVGRGEIQAMTKRCRYPLFQRLPMLILHAMQTTKDIRVAHTDQKLKSSWEITNESVLVMKQMQQGYDLERAHH
jgi:hypothetical protein